jgi:hypothetical protein
MPQTSAIRGGSSVAMRVATATASSPGKARRRLIASYNVAAIEN